VIIFQVIQKRAKPHPAYFIGKGKAEELAKLSEELGADLLIFNEDLSPLHQRNLEDLIGRKVISRTELILDIFAQRAKTAEGKLQVELAQATYLLPRLTGKGVSLSRLGGGIGTRGPGETKLEIDRRRIREKITLLKRGIGGIRKHRAVQRKMRQNRLVPLIALVGYTNTGKSTLLNSLTEAQVFVEDKLFATLDPTTRILTLPGRQRVLLTDTVGFIHRLPHNLVSAFRATLEEVREADLLVNVVDLSHPKMKEQTHSTYEILGELEARNKPLLTVFNKIDKLEDEFLIKRALRETPDSVAISALQKKGLEELKAKIGESLKYRRKYVKLSIPYGEERIISMLHKEGRIIKKEYQGKNIIIEAEVEEKIAKWLESQVEKRRLKCIHFGF
jgi:GTP-binding protein HflX